MKHHYSTIDNVHTTFSDIYASETKGESIIVHMERATEKDSISPNSSSLVSPAQNVWVLQKMNY